MTNTNQEKHADAGERKGDAEIHVLVPLQDQDRKETEARKKQHIIEIKEIKFRPGTDTHDYDVKMRSVLKFIEHGDKVKVTLRFRGREMAHQNLGRELLERVAEDTKEAGRVENFPKMEGRQMVMLIGPLPK